MTDTKPSPVQLVIFFQIFNALTTHIHSGKFTTAFWAIPGMSQHKTVAAENTVFEVSAGLPKSRQGVSGCSAHPAETR